MIKLTLVLTILGVTSATLAQQQAPQLPQLPPLGQPASPVVSSTPVGQGYDNTTSTFYTDIAVVHSDGTVDTVRIPRVPNSPY